MTPPASPAVAWWRGRRTVKALPCPTWLATSTSSWASQRCGRYGLVMLQDTLRLQGAPGELSTTIIRPVANVLE